MAGARMGLICVSYPRRPAEVKLASYRGLLSAGCLRQGSDRIQKSIRFIKTGYYNSISPSRQRLHEESCRGSYIRVLCMCRLQSKKSRLGHYCINALNTLKYNRTKHGAETVAGCVSARGQGLYLLTHSCTGVLASTPLILIFDVQKSRYVVFSSDKQITKQDDSSREGRAEYIVSGSAVV